MATIIEKKDEEVKALRLTKAYKDAEPKARLLMLLDLMTFDELVERGYLLDPAAMAQRTGFTPQHVRRLAHDGVVPCLRRTSHDKSGTAWIYFLREQVSDFWTGK